MNITAKILTLSLGIALVACGMLHWRESTHIRMTIGNSNLARGTTLNSPASQ